MQWRRRKLFNSDNIQIGVAAIEAHKPFSDNILELFECFCDVLNKELAKSDYYRKYGQEYQEKLINLLIEGGVEEIGIYTAHVQSIYMNLDNYLHIAVADVSKCNDSDKPFSYFRDLFMHTCPAFKYSIYANYIVFIISSDYAALDVKKDLGKLDRLFKLSNICAGISSCFDDLFDLRKYYLEAVGALSEGMANGGEDRFFLYERS